MTDVASGRAAKWRAWLAENLVRGVAPESLARTLVQAGLEPEHARAEVESTLGHPAVARGWQRARLHRQLQAQLESREALHRQSGWHRRLERRRRVGAHEFLERYYLAHQPVVLEGMMEGWPALERWQPRRLAERYGHLEVEVMVGRESHPDHDLHPDRCRAVMRFGDFLRCIQEDGPSNDVYLTARNFALEHAALRELREDVRDLEGILRRTGAAGEVKLWVGPAGTLTQLHHDLGNVLFGQVHGRKRFKLIPSFQSHRVYSHLDVWSQVDAEQPDLERFPDYREADVLETVLQPGEMLLIPAGWWHWVQALDVSVSVTFQAFDVPGGNTWWKMR